MAIPVTDPLASYAYHASEILQIPLYCLLNTIFGRLYTVLNPGEFGNYKTGEVARRVLLTIALIPVLPATVIATPLAILLNVVGDLFLGREPSLRLLGTYKGEKKNTFATFNMATLLPTMTLTDGVEYSNERLKRIASQLKNFHFVCGQEVDGASARFFSRELKSHFTEFHTYLGKSNVPFLPSGLFFACKERVIKVTVAPFTGAGVQKALKRQLVIFELEDYCVATMHLDGGISDDKALQELHEKEMRQAKDELAKCKKPMILCGDFNDERYDGKRNSAFKNVLGVDFIDCIASENKNIETCTDDLKKKRFGSTLPPSVESIDYITYSKNQKKLSVEFIGRTYSLYLSDHHLVEGKIVLSV